MRYFKRIMNASRRIKIRDGRAITNFRCRLSLSTSESRCVKIPSPPLPLFSLFFFRRTKLFEFSERWNRFGKKKKILARFDSTFNIGFFRLAGNARICITFEMFYFETKAGVVLQRGYEVTAEPIQFQERVLFDVLNITGSGICRLFRNVF